MHLPYAKPPYHTELAPTERPFRWPRRPRDNQRPSKFLVLLPISWFSIGQKNRPTPSSQPKSWCSCQPPDTIRFTTIMTQPGANKDPETAASCQIFNDLLRSWPKQQPANALMLLSAANSPLSHDNRKLTSIPTDRAIDQPINSQTRPTNQIEQTNQTGQSTNIQIIQVRPAD